MTIENYFSDKNFIELPDLNELGIDAEIFTNLTARDLESNALILAFEDVDGTEKLALVHPDKIEVREYLYNEDNLDDSLTYNSACELLRCCGFNNFSQPDGSIFIYNDMFYYILTDNTISHISYDEEGNLYKVYSENMAKKYNYAMIEELEVVLGRELHPRLVWTIEIDTPVVNVCGEDYMTQEEYLKVLTDKLSDSEIVELLEDSDIVKEAALHEVENLDEVIHIIEDKLVCKFIQSGKNSSYIREKILEKILN